MRARALVKEASTLPPSNVALQKLAVAEVGRAESGCKAARPLLAETVTMAGDDEHQMIRLLATVDLAECEAEAGDVRAARERLEVQLAWLTNAGAEDVALAPVRKALANLPR